MTYRLVTFPMTFNDFYLDFKVTADGVTIGLDALDVLRVQLTRDLSAIAKFFVLKSTKFLGRYFLACPAYGLGLLRHAARSNAKIRVSVQ